MPLAESNRFQSHIPLFHMLTRFKNAHMADCCRCLRGLTYNCYTIIKNKYTIVIIIRYKFVHFVTILYFCFPFR